MSFEGTCDRCHRWGQLAVVKRRDLCSNCRRELKEQQGAQLELGEVEIPDVYDPRTAPWPEGY